MEWILSLDPRLVTVAQFVSQSLFATMSAVVTLVALNIGYRNNFGWKPIILSRQPYMADLKKGPGMGAGVSFEVWNRQKYPIVLRQMRVTFGELKLVEALGQAKDNGWLVTAGGKIVHRYEQTQLEPNKHESFSVLVRFEPDGPYEDFPGVESKIEVQVFDPKKNKTYLLTKVDKPLPKGSLKYPLDW